MPRRIIKLVTAPDDTVLDCFMGSGTTAVAAIREKRNYLGIELVPKYVELACSMCEREKQSVAFLGTQYEPESENSELLLLKDV